MENKRMSELPVATMVGDEDYTIIVQDGINKRASREIFKQKEYNNLNHIPYINSNYSSSLVPANELLQGTIQFHKISKTGRYSDLLDLPFIPTNLTHLTNDGYFVQDQYYIHTDNNLTSGLINKIDSAIQCISVNNTLLTPNENQEVNIVIPINLTDLTNDGYFVQDPNYTHTDNNFTTILKNSYDNLVSNVNQIVSSTNKLATMNDLLAIDSGYWVVIDLYKDITFDGVINAGDEIPTIGIYAVIEGTDNLTISKYTNGVSDDLQLPIKEGYFVFVNGNDTELIYYIKENVWKKLSTDLSNYYNKQEGDNRYVQKEEGKDLITSEEKEKLAEISIDANHVQKSNINGNIRIDGEETVVYSLTKGEVINALGYTPIEATADLSDYYDKQQSDNRYVQKENDKELITSVEKTKLAGISTNANKVEKSNTNGNIKIDGVETNVYSITKNEVISALGYTPIENLSDYYNKQQSDNRYVQKETGKELITSEEKTKLSGISSGANKVENSITNGNIKIDGVETTVYSLTKAEVIEALGYTPPTTNTTYSVVTTSKNGLMSSDMLTKLNGITDGADSVSFSRNLTSGTKVGTININGTDTDIYAPTNTDTHYTSHLYVGTSSGNTNAATTNGNTYLIAVDNTTVRDRRLIKGTGGTTVTSDSDGNITINSDIGGSSTPKTIYADFMTNYDWYDDGTDLTSAEGLTSDIYDQMEPGVILEYATPYSWTTTNYSLILYQKSYYSYKPEGGRYFIREYTMIDYSGYLSTYTFSADYLSGDDTIYKGANLSENYGGGGVACFTGETLINTENGFKEIKDLKENDKVYSKNKQGAVELKEIVATFSHITEKIYKIDIGSSIINASWSHPFYVVGKGKVLSKDLRAEDKLETIKNNIKLIKRIEILEQPTEVFEIKIKDNLNYFVGTDNILVGCEDLDKLKYRKGDTEYGANK